MGKTKAKVFPLPVGAETQISLGRYPALPIWKPVLLDSSKAGITCLCTGMDIKNVTMLVPSLR